MAMLPDTLRRDRERWGMRVGEAGWRLGSRAGSTSPRQTADPPLSQVGWPS